VQPSCSSAVKPSAPIQKSQKELCFDLDSAFEKEVQELAREANNLFDVLDSSSKRIRDLESTLSDLKANFPFQIELTERQRRWEGSWYLAWDLDDCSKKFRLLLIGSLGCDGCEDSPPPLEIRKPLIEADLGTRLRFSEYLSPFVNQFRDHLRKRRIAIEDGIRMSDECIPF
jgi:hypothetical protein